MSVDARGAFGPGIVLGKWGGTNYARKRIRTPQRMTPEEGVVKERLILGSRSWGALSQAQRDDWDTYAATITRYDSMGQAYSCPGVCEYICNYAITKMLGTAAPTDAPLIPNPGYVEGLGVAMGEPGYDVIVVFDQGQTIEWVEIFLTEIKGPGIMGRVQKTSVIHGLKPTTFKSWHGPYTGVNMKRQWRIRGLMESGQWGPWLTGIVPPTYP